MEASVIIGFFANYNIRNEIEELFNGYGINILSPEKPKNKLNSEVFYEIPVIINETNNINIISNIYKYLEIDFNFSCSETISFKFDENDFDNSPFYELRSTGNSAKAFLKTKKHAIKWNSICKDCGLQVKEQQSQLFMDTSKLDDRYMVNVDTDYWVVSEKMALLMEKWKITGYELNEVIHTGSNKGQIAYQILPTNTLPVWSSEMKHYYFLTQQEGRCSVCNIRGRIDYPYHYNKSDIEQYPIKDINIMKEWKSNGEWAYRPVFLSKRFRNLLIENGITHDVRDMYAKNYKSKDWLFDPVIIVNN